MQARQLEYTTLAWPATLTAALVTARRIEGGLATVDALLGELNNPEIFDLTGVWNDPVKPFVSLLLLVQSGPAGKMMLETLVRERLPTLLGETGFHVPQGLITVFRLSLSVISEVKPEWAQRLVSDLVDELAHQRSRPKSPARDVGNKRKAPASAAGGRPLPTAARRLVDLFIKSFDDDESRTRWPVVARLVR